MYFVLGSLCLVTWVSDHGRFLRWRIGTRTKYKVPGTKYSAQDQLQL